MSDSRITGFYGLPVGERIDELERREWLSAADAAALKSGRHVLSVRSGDKMIENVIATFGLPMAVAPNFRVNGRDYVVPLVVEEPSIVAGLSASAMHARTGNGFETRCEDSLATGQVHLTGIGNIDAAVKAIGDARKKLIAAANDVHPRLVERGGGVRDIEVRRLQLDEQTESLAVHLLVDTCDAMGANLVNTICEAVAPAIAELCDANVAMRILSNLSDRSMVSAKVCYRCDDLGSDRDTATRTRDAIVLANDIACADPYRAATHNKGIMNGIDPLAIATGNDWRAIEAGAHAYAAEGGRYTALTCWSVNDEGDLEGQIRLPLKVGIVGGTLDTNAAARIGLRLAGVTSAAELAQLMAAVGLAQNFAALRALVTSGIQHGHMRMHARSVAAAACVPDELFDDVVTALVESGDIKVWKAREILAAKRDSGGEQDGFPAAGKVILFGEHAVVYGRHALALPVENGIVATAEPADTSSISIPAWGVNEAIGDVGRFGDAVLMIARELGIDSENYVIRVASKLPPAMGLGASAALAVAITRALAGSFRVTVDDERVNQIAFACEKLAHGTPSGVDNTIATYATPLLFRRGDVLETSELVLDQVPPIVIGCSLSHGSTFEQVRAVRSRYEDCQDQIDAVFDHMDALALAGVDALQQADYEQLGRLMNICHGLLNAIGVSTAELEHMVSIARSAGALGAKLTGGGGGGSIIALCPGNVDEVTNALEAAGFATLRLTGHGESAVG